MSFTINSVTPTEIYLNNILITQIVDKSNNLIWNRYNNCIFYGGTNSTPAASNLTTIISNTNTLTVSETAVGTAREYPGGAACGINALFYGGSNQGNTAWYNNLTVINKTATIVGSETMLGTARAISYGGARAARNALFYGGMTGVTYYSTLTIFNESINLVQSESNIGTLLDLRIGTESGQNAMYFSGYYYILNQFTLLNSTGTALLLENYNASSAKKAGASVGVNSLYTGGTAGASLVCSLISPSGTLLKPEATVGGTMARGGMSGGFAGINALFYGGLNATPAYVNFCDAISPNMTTVGTEQAIGTARQMIGSASIG